MAFFLPLHIGISNIFLILFFVSSAYLFLVKKIYKTANFKILYFTLLPLFLLYVFGLFYSEPPFIGTKVLGRTVAFLLCPILMLFHTKPTLIQLRKHILNGIVVGSLISIIVLLIINFLNYFATRPFPKFDQEIFGFAYTYHNFTQPFVEYATYLGAYVVFSVAILLHRLVSEKKQSKWPLVLGIGILSIGVLFINARIIFFLFFLALTSTLIWSLIRFIRNRMFFAVASLVVLATICIWVLISALSNSFIVSRLTSELEWELSDQVNTEFNTKIKADSRIARWESAIEAVENKPVIGYGTYTEKDVLAHYYQKNGLIVSYNNRYDAHNLYFSFLIEYGIVGLLFLILFLITNLFIAIKYNDVEFLFLILMIIAISCFENYLQNNAAITFVALFSTVFLFSNISSINSKRNV